MPQLVAIISTISVLAFAYVHTVYAYTKLLKKGQKQMQICYINVKNMAPVQLNR